jgi:hypothetical protein
MSNIVLSHEWFTANIVLNLAETTAILIYKKIIQCALCIGSNESIHVMCFKVLVIMERMYLHH